MSTHPIAQERGFTLIELLVVIAIIGILSSVILASLYLSRLKGADAAIKSDLHTIQTQIELYYGNGTNTYGAAQASQSSAISSMPTFNPAGNVFVADQTIYTAMKAALAQGGSAYYAVGKSGASYAVAVKLKGNSGYWWCIDSTNAPKQEADAVMTGAALAGGSSAAAVCP